MEWSHHGNSQPREDCLHTNRTVGEMPPLGWVLKYTAKYDSVVHVTILSGG